MSESSPIEFAIIGCGAITEQSYLPALMRMPECKIVSLVDADLDRARQIAQQHAIPNWSDNIDAIPATTKAAIVAVPNFLHAPISCQLMTKGVHVLCEKPMAITKEEAEAMVHCSEEHGVTLSIGHVRRFYWCNQRIKEIMDSRRFGHLRSFHMEYGFPHDWPTVSGFYYDKSKSGGGVFIDVGSHLVDLVLWWLQDHPTAVRYHHDACGGVESECLLEMDFGDSLKGSIALSRLRQFKIACSLQFEEATVSYRAFDTSAISHALTIQQHGKESQWHAEKTLRFEDYLEEQIKDFMRNIQTGIPSINSARSVVPSVALIETCYKNAKQLRPAWFVSSQGNHEHEPMDEAFVLRQAKILVTGASGFIGGRIVEQLNLAYNNVPRCLVRNVHKLARIARFPSDVVVGDLLDYDSLVKATAGCDVVIHCAYGNTPDDATNQRINTVGTENLLRAALQNGIKRFIYLSSVEVYGFNAPPVVTEETPTAPGRYSYSWTKLEGEKICLKYFRENSLPVVILRLAAVYGPYAPTWTIGVVNYLSNGGFCQNEKFDGVCNPVYVDDCVQAIFLALTRKDILGETFLISSGEKLTWNEYFSRYNEFLGFPPLRKASFLELQFYRVVRELWDWAFRMLKPQRQSGAFFTYHSMREKGRIPNLKAFLQRGTLLRSLDIFSRHSYYSIDKAQKELGFAPRYSLAVGLPLVKQWLEHVNRLDEGL